MSWAKQGIIYDSTKRLRGGFTHATVPVFLKSDKFWRVYFGIRDNCNKSVTTFVDFEPGNFGKIIQDCQLPVFARGNIGSFDEGGQMPTCVIKNGDDVYLYYIGWSVKLSVPLDNHTGLAISRDGGTTFDKFDGPVLGKSIYDPYFTGTCYVLRMNDIWHAYYQSGVGWTPPGASDNTSGRMEPLYHIRHATSPDGIHWTPIEKPVIALKDDEAGICQVSVIKVQNKYLMWYCYRKMKDYRTEPKDAYRIGFAMSVDGYKWERLDDYRSLRVSDTGWDSTMVCCPNVFWHDEKFWMLYNGNSFGKTGFGYAIWDGEDDSLLFSPS